MKPVPERPGWQVLLVRGALFAVLWWILSGGDHQSWWVGAPVVFVAVIVSRWLLPAVPLSWWELVKFTPLFLWRSVLGGLDVAKRALGPQLAISPRLLRYRLRLPDRLPRVALLNIMSLLPGTLSAALEGDDLLVHVLDGEGDTLAELQALEQQVARLSGVTLTGDHKGERNEAI